MGRADIAHSQPPARPSTAPSAAWRDPEPDAPTDKDLRSRTVWIQATHTRERVEVEIFTGVFLDTQWPNTSAVTFPAPIKAYEYHPADAEVISTQAHSEAGILHVAARHPITTGSGAEVRVTLADGSLIVLRILTRPNFKDIQVTLLERPVLNTEDVTRHIGERLSSCVPENKPIEDKTRLIADRGSLAVLNRSFGNGYIAKQTNGLELTFADVVHDGTLSYLTLIIANHSGQDWPVDLGQIRLTHRGTDVRVISRASQSSVIGPSKKSRVVLAYETPTSAHEFSVVVEDAGLLVGVIP